MTAQQIRDKQEQHQITRELARSTIEFSRALVADMEEKRARLRGTLEYSRKVSEESRNLLDGAPLRTED